MYNHELGLKYDNDEVVNIRSDNHEYRDDEDVNIRSDGNNLDSQKGLSRLSQNFAMSNFMMMMMNSDSYDDHHGQKRVEMIIADFSTADSRKSLSRLPEKFATRNFPPDGTTFQQVFSSFYIVFVCFSVCCCCCCCCYCCWFIHYYE